MVSESDIGRMRRLNERDGTAATTRLMGADGMPADRSLCPWCTGQSMGCVPCGGTGVVCPKCRGARVLRHHETERSRYTGCTDCTDWSDHTAHSWGGDGGDFNWPVYQRNVDRELAAVSYYRRTRRDADVARAMSRK